jgi:hypothetical protein
MGKADLVGNKWKTSLTSVVMTAIFNSRFTG